MINDQRSGQLEHVFMKIVVCVCVSVWERVCVCLRERQCVWVCVRERESIFIASISFTCMEENAFANGSYQYMFTEENTFGGAPCLFIILGNNTLWKQPVSVYAYRREYILRWCMSVCAHIRIYIWGGVCLLVLTEEYTFESGHYQFILVSKCSLYTFYNNPAPLNGSMQFHYCTDSNPGTGADDTFVLERGVWRNATWPSHSRPAVAASARHFQICFSPLTFWPLVCLPTLCLPSPFYALSYV